MKQITTLEKMYCMSRYYFAWIQLFICCCFISLAHMFNNRWMILIGYLQIFLLPNPETYNEIYQKCGDE